MSMIEQPHSLNNEEKEEINEAIKYLAEMGIKNLPLHNSILESEAPTHEEVALNILMIIFCLISSALAAAMMFGVLTIDPFQLQVEARTSPDERKRHQASSLIPLVLHKRHELLVTLLIINACANEALPIFLDELVPSTIAILISVTGVLLFGDVLPTAVFTGPNKIYLSSLFVPLMKFLMIILCPLAYPIAALLSCVLGHGDTTYNRNEIAAFVRINYEERRRIHDQQQQQQQQHNQQQEEPGEGLKQPLLSKNGHSSKLIGLDEVLLVEGALNLKTKKVLDVLKPLHEVYLLKDDLVLSQESLLEIYLSGYSRIPIYTNSKPSLKTTEEEEEEEDLVIVDKTPTDFEQRTYAITGILFSKQLITTPLQTQLSSLELQQPMCIPPDLNLIEMLKSFQSTSLKGTNITSLSIASSISSKKSDAFKGGHGQLAIVCRFPQLANEALNNKKPIPKEADVIGIVTLEDVIEELIQEDITDEADFREQHVIGHCQLLNSNEDDNNHLHLYDKLDDKHKEREESEEDEEKDD